MWQISCQTEVTFWFYLIFFSHFYFLLLKCFWMHWQVLWNAPVHDADSVWLEGTEFKAPNLSCIYHLCYNCSAFVPSFMWKHSFIQHSTKHIDSRVSWLSIKESKFYKFLQKKGKITIHYINPSKHLVYSIKVNSGSRWLMGQMRLTCNGFNGFAWDRLTNEIILNKAGRLRRDLHWMLRPFGPSIDHLSFRIGICRQTAKPPGCESLTVNCEYRKLKI